MSIESYKTRDDNAWDTVAAPVRTGTAPRLFSIPVDFSGEGLIQIAWQRRWVVLLFLIAVPVLAVLYLTQATPFYTSTSRLYVEQTGPKIITKQEGVMTRTKNYLHTQAELLKSMPILASVVDDPAVAKLKTFDGVNNRIGYLNKHLGVVVGKKDDLINVSFECPYPHEAALLVNTLVDSYITYHSTHKRTTTSEVLKILRAEKVKRDRELDEKFQKLVEFTRAHGIVSPENSNNNVVLNRLERLSQALTDVQLEIVQAKADYDSVESLMKDPDSVRRFLQSRQNRDSYLSANSQPHQLRAEMEKLRNQLNILLQQSTSHHPAVQSLLVQVAQLKRQITEQENNFIQAYRASLIQQWITAMQKETEITSAFQQQQKLALEQNAWAAEYTVLQSNLKRTEKACDKLDSNIKEINVTEDTGALNISILEVARPTERPSRPNKTSILALSVLLGLILGLGMALLCDRADTRLRNAPEISALLGVPVLGSVPSIAGKETLLTRGQTVLLRPSSAAAESYRSIRTAVYFGVPSQQARTILITSPNEGDGKTTVLSNLAITMAQSGQRTLIIAGDLRRPTQHIIFRTDSSVEWEPPTSQRIAGLAEIISDNKKPEDVIRHTKVDGLDVLPAGQVQSNPSEILNSSAFADIVNQLARQYDRILIDSPPVLSVTDARILGGICDLTILVLRAEKSTRKAAEQAHNGLLSVGTHLLGVVVNDVARNCNRYDYYSGYLNNTSQYSEYAGDNRSPQPQGVINTPVIKTAIDDAATYDHARQNTEERKEEFRIQNSEEKKID